MKRKELGHIPDAELEADDRACVEDVRQCVTSYRICVREGVDWPISWGEPGETFRAAMVRRLRGNAKTRAVIASERARRRGG